MIFICMLHVYVIYVICLYSHAILQEDATVQREFIENEKQLTNKLKRV